MKTPLITIGCITYNSLPYLAHFLGSLFKQSFQDFEIIITDNGSKDESVAYIKKNFPIVRINESKENLGFGKAHNQMVKEAKGQYYLLLNPDMFFDEYCIEELVNAIKEDDMIGCVGPKIYRWNTDKSQEENRRERGILDTTGISVTKAHHFYDRGQGKEDSLTYTQKEEVFGISGACMLLRKEAALAIAQQGQVFDEEMFMYKEDVDLCYRLRWQRWKCVYAPASVAYHDRTTYGTNDFAGKLRKRKERGNQVKIWSVQNHLITVLKNFSPAYPLSLKVSTLAYTVGMFGFCLLFEPKGFFAMISVLHNRKNKVKPVEKRATPEELLRFFT